MKKPILKYFCWLLLVVACIAKNERALGQAIANEGFERADILSGSTPVSWTNANSSDPGFATVSGSFTDNSLTYNAPTSGSSRIMSAVLGGASFDYTTTQPPCEWTLLYQTPDSVVPTDNDGPSVSGDNWRFYFSSTTTNPGSGSTYNTNFKGYYVTQDGNFLKFFYLCGNCKSRTQVGNSVSVVAGHKYIIRAVRQSNNGGTYLFYATEYTGTSSFPTSAVNSAANDQVGSSYLNSFFQSSVSSSGHNGIFKWDNLSFYRATLTLSPLNNVGLGAGGNGIAAFLTQGDNQKAVFGFKATALGSVTLTQADFSWTTTGSGNSFYFSGAKLYYSSADDVYSPASDDNSIGTVQLNYGSASISGLSQPITNSSRNYFLVVDVSNYSSVTTATASIGLTSVKISGNSPINIPSTATGISFTLPATPTTWTGATSKAWNISTNWNGGVPLSSSSVIIPTGKTNYPQLVAGVSVGTLSMANASIDLNGQVLKVSGSILANNSTVNSTTAGSYFDMTDGTGDRSISGTGLTITNLKIDLPTSSNTVNVYAPVQVSNLLTMTSGILSSGGNLTLTSTSTGSANLDIISSTATASVTGSVNVQRYISGGSANSRGYRLLSSPVSVSGSSQIIPSLTYIANSAYTTGTTGTNGGFAAVGNPTIYLYRENMAPLSTSFTSGNNRGISSINTGSSFTINGDDGSYNIPAGNGILFFFRGDKATTANPTVTTTIAQPSTFTASGYLNQGNIVVKDWFTPASTKLSYTSNTANTNIRGFNLVGNPYASSINWDKWNTSALPETNISNKIWTYNPKLKVYATYVAGGGGVGTNTTGTTANIIPSGEGFFVRATDVNPALTFTENAKVTTQVPAADLMLAGAANDVAAPMQYLRVQVMKDSLNAEDALIFFKSKAKPEYVQNEDAEYLRGNSVVNISTQSTDKIALAINQLALPKKAQTIPLNVNVTNSGTFSLNLCEAKNIPAVYDIWLMDAYKKDSLDIKHNPHYSFTANTGDAASFGSGRFSVVIRPNPALTVHLLNFDATKSTNDVKINWTAENEAAYTTYIVERSTDAGKTYKVLDSLTSAGLGRYNDLDPSPVLGDNYYRLKQIDVTGNISYSNVIKVMYANTANTILANNNISVYPNPAVSTLNLAITNVNAPNKATLSSASYKISITNSVGLVVKTETSANASWQGQIDNLMPGTYFIQVINTKDNTLTGKSTFVKL